MLRDRRTLLNEALQNTSDDMEYGGAATQAVNLDPLMEAVDEAQQMVCAIGGEMKRRRSEAESPFWKKSEAAASVTSVRIVLAGV